MGIVYTCFTTDVIHAGHLNIIHEAQKYGDVVVGVMTDKALVQFDRFPTISFYERKKTFMKSIKPIIAIALTFAFCFCCLFLF